MKNSGLTIFICLLASSLFFCQKEGQAKIKEWKYGFAIDETGKVLYHDFTMQSGGSPIVTFDLTKDEIKKIKGGLVMGRAIQIAGDKITIDNALKKRLNRPHGSRIIKYKIENNAGYVSSDGKKWEKLQIKYLRETGEDDSRGYPIVYVYFECGFFKGEYQLGFGF